MRERGEDGYGRTDQRSLLSDPEMERAETGGILAARISDSDADSRGRRGTHVGDEVGWSMGDFMRGILVLLLMFAAIARSRGLMDCGERT